MRAAKTAGIRVLGIDVGTQGVRALVLSERGKVLGQAAVGFPYSPQFFADGSHQQDPQMWWKAVLQCLTRLRKHEGIPLEAIDALSVDSTSGTVVAVDETGEPLMPAIMYNDARAANEALQCNQAAGAFLQKMGYRFSASFALPKILWIKKHLPHLFGKVHKFLPPASFILGKLSGDLGVADASNSLKWGYDLVEDEWPDFIPSLLQLPTEKLPRVVNTGTLLGPVCPQAVGETGMKKTTQVVAGATDGSAAFFCSGASQPGEFCSSLGSTLIVRGVSRAPIMDPQGRIYCHRHPDGFWLPGGASNVGGECLNVRFPNKPLSEMDTLARPYFPTSLLVYPLVRKGERLPFVSKDFQGFVQGTPKSEAELYAAHLEGVAFVERWVYEILRDLTGHPVSKIVSTGGATASDVWLQVRADILNTPIHVPEISEPAFGIALVAVAAMVHQPLTQTCRKGVRFKKVAEPRKAFSRIYEQKFPVFKSLCQQKLAAL